MFPPSSIINHFNGPGITYIFTSVYVNGFRSLGWSFAAREPENESDISELCQPFNKE